MRFFKLRMKRFLTAVFLSAAILQVAADRPNSLGPLVALLNQSQDVTFQLDVLKGISQAMQGRSKAEMIETLKRTLEDESLMPVLMFLYKEKGEYNSHTKTI